MLNELEHAAKVVGVKQVRRVLANGRAKCVYLAKDAEIGRASCRERV